MTTTQTHEPDGGRMVSPISRTTRLHGTPHGSLVDCAHCGHPFEPRIKRGSNRDRFCSSRCKDFFWNERRAERRGIAPPGTAGPTRSPPSVAAESAGGMGQEIDAAHHTPKAQIHKGSKIYAIASALLRGERLDCFRAVRDYHDYVLRSTISDLANMYGVTIDRTPKIVPGYRGSRVECVEYSVSGAGAQQLARLLGGCA